MECNGFQRSQWMQPAILLLHGKVRLPMEVTTEYTQSDSMRSESHRATNFKLIHRFQKLIGVNPRLLWIRRGILLLRGAAMTATGVTAISLHSVLIQPA